MWQLCSKIQFTTSIGFCKTQNYYKDVATEKDFRNKFLNKKAQYQTVCLIQLQIRKNVSIWTEAKKNCAKMKRVGAGQWELECYFFPLPNANSEHLVSDLRLQK